MSTPRNAFWRWTFIGAFTAVVLIWSQAAEVGGIPGLLQVGESSDLRPLIEGQLGEIPLSPAGGHDGQIYYMIGLDLDGDQSDAYLIDASLRYRRILYPLISSGFGLLGGHALLYGMISVSTLSFALLAGVFAWLVSKLGMRDWWAAVVVLNPGLWLSVRLLTPDVMALALTVGALALFLTKLAASRALFSLSVLTKDVFIVTPVGLSATPHQKRWLTAVIPASLLLVWTIWLTFQLGNGFTPRGNLDLPFMGMVNSRNTWIEFDTAEWAYLLFAIGSVLLGLVVGIFSRNWLRWSVLGWAVLGVISSNWVWDFGNNAARVLAPIAVLIVLNLRNPTSVDTQITRSGQGN